MSSRRLIGLCVLLGLLVVGRLGWRNVVSQRQITEPSVPSIDRHPISFETRTFDPEAPPSDLPPLTPGENAECDSNFSSDASVSGDTRETDSTHATLTIKQIKMTLNLNVIIWVPTGVTQQVIEHEEGHHRISEYYYQTADKVAGRVASSYMGKQVEISGTDLDGESNKMLQQIATEITDEYSRELNPGPTQLLYDSITDHGRNQVVVKDAVASAITNIVMD